MALLMAGINPVMPGEIWTRLPERALPIYSFSIPKMYLPVVEYTYLVINVSV